MSYMCRASRYTEKVGHMTSQLYVSCDILDH